MSPRARRASRVPSEGGATRDVTARTLRRMPLPDPDDGGDKEDRGRVLVVGGAATLPGALVLAGTAVLRAGAGKLQLATTEPVALHVGVAVPEALVLGVAEGAGGGIAARGADEIADYAERADCVLIGPGLVDERAIARLLATLLPRVRRGSVVLDAGALAPLGDDPGLLRHLGGRVAITPHAGEMASLLGIDRHAVEGEPAAAARAAAEALGAVVALKGPVTHIAEPGGAMLRYDRGRVGLATSGSGDTLAGLVAGLLARGAPPLVATAWGVFLHGEAGNALSRRLGRVGYLARELLDEVPGIMARLAK